jgi:hydroxyacylglutathione hydrolase
MEIKAFTFNPFLENTYLLYDDTKQCIIVDPGCSHHDEEKELKDFITDHDLTPVRLLNTHCHIDHILGNRYISDSYGLALEAHIKESDNIKKADAYAMMFGMKTPATPEISIYLEEGQDIHFGNTSITVLYTPGHSPGHVVFYENAGKIIIGGDVLFKEGIGRTDLPGGNYQTLMSSIREKLFVLDDNITVYPGHGPFTTIGYEKQYNPFLQEVIS